MNYYKAAFRYHLAEAEEFARLGDTIFEKIQHMKAKKALERMCGLHGTNLLSI
jgi:hypothetical protein